MSDVSRIDPLAPGSDRHFIGVMARVRQKIQSGEIAYPQDGDPMGDPCPICGARPRLRLRPGITAPTVIEVPNGPEREQEYNRLSASFVIRHDEHDAAMHGTGTKANHQRALELQPPRRTFNPGDHDEDA